jgi:hypothetical protein
MRTLAASALSTFSAALSVAVLPLILVSSACGGGQGAGPVAPPGAGSAAPADTTAASAGPSTTTTSTLAGNGDAQGTKLDAAPAASSSSAAPAGSAGAKGPHSHDPGRGPADIRAIVVAHRDEARACYDAALKDHPGIEGDLVMQWTIDPKGAVTAVSQDTTRSTIVEPGAVACIAKILQAIQFAPSPGGFETKAMYPFNFHPRKSTGTQGSGGQ